MSLAPGGAHTLHLSARPLEFQEQQVYFQWLDHVRINGELLRPHVYAVPNGGHRHIAVASKMKAEGVTAGIPDINVDVPSGKFHGLRLEMKRIGEHPSEEQQRQIELRRKMGYEALVAQGFAVARIMTTRYLSASWLVVDRWAS